jgi:hypothetical protein
MRSNLRQRSLNILGYPPKYGDQSPFASSVLVTHPDLEHSSKEYGAVERSPVSVQFINASTIGANQATSECLKVASLQRCLHRASRGVLSQLFADHHFKKFVAPSLRISDGLGFHAHEQSQQIWSLICLDLSKNI